jgi:hypothetical protein
MNLSPYVLHRSHTEQDCYSYLSSDAQVREALEDYRFSSNFPRAGSFDFCFLKGECYVLGSLESKVNETTERIIRRGQT